MNPDPLVKFKVHRLGCVPYSAGLEAQREFWRKRRDDEIPDTLLLLEHSPVITYGARKDGARDILFSAEELARRGIEMYQTDRGGLATLHLPGQIVGYFFVAVRRIPGGLRSFIRLIEQGLIDTCGQFGIAAHAGTDEPGVWVRRDGSAKKLASLGLAVRSGVSRHGFGLNVDPDLSLFEALRPCGNAARVMTSMAQQAEVAVSREAVLERLEEVFRGIFAGSESIAVRREFAG